MQILITGAAGFIGFHTAKFEMEKGNYVIGVDNLNQYYDVKIKKDRLKILKKYKKYQKDSKGHKKEKSNKSYKRYAIDS
mgnify:CR=1 FL=1